MVFGVPELDYNACPNQNFGRFDFTFDPAFHFTARNPVRILSPGKLPLPGILPLLGSFIIGSFIFSLTGLQTVAAQDMDLQSAIEAIKTVDVKGQGHDQAVAAMATLNAATADDVPQLLQGMDGANKIALNWLRGGVQSALDKGPLPRKEIQAFLQDTEGSDMGRFMAFELLSEGNPEFSSETLPALVSDPSLPLRQLAVADAIERAKAKVEQEDVAGGIGLLSTTLPHAREVAQVQAIVSSLAESGVQVDLQKQLGFIPNWHIVGPFDNTEEAGFDKAMGPEADPANVDVAVTYDDSKTGEAIGWQQHNSIESTGVVDLNSILKEEKGVIAYGYTEFNSEAEQQVDIRIGCINGNKVWVNGVEVINNEIYHVGMMPDQFVGQVTLKEGVNKILFKVCQNEQTQPWANRWMFQMRICKSDGLAVLPFQPAPARR